MKTVNMKSSHVTSATILSRLFSIRMLAFPEYVDSSSEVTSRMIAVIASQKLMSQRDKGKLTVSLPKDSVIGFNCLAV